MPSRCSASGGGPWPSGASGVPEPQEEIAGPHLERDGDERPVLGAEALDLVHVRRLVQGAVEAIRPGVIGALQVAAHLALGIGAEERAAVAAHVVERAHHAGLVAHQQGLGGAEAAHQVAARLGHVVGAAGEHPHGAKQRVALAREVRRVGVIAGGQGPRTDVGGRSIIGVPHHRGEPITAFSGMTKKPSKPTRSLARRPIVQAPLAQLPKVAGNRRALGRARSEETLFPSPPPTVELPSSYAKVLGELKQRIEQTRLATVLTAMTRLSHNPSQAGTRGMGSEGDRSAVLRSAASVSRHGRAVSTQPEVHARVRVGVDRPRNCASTACTLTWYHHLALIEKLDAKATRLWYAARTVEQGWSRNIHPGMVGQLHMYLSAVDDLIKQPDDQPTIGLLLCRGKNELVVEYALRDQRRPMGVADWETQLVEKLPDALKGGLPSIEEIEAGLAPPKQQATKRKK